ncbi:MAG: glucose-6-phosphate isomerase family protein [Candidatus Micrarchaeia archaeon]
MVLLDVRPLKLSFVKGGLFLGKKKLKPSVRTLRELQDVVQDIRFLVEADQDMRCYFMYRDLYPPLAEKGLRYDITILPPIRLGKEFNKTMGHYHPEAREGLSYCELYEVLQGRAHYLLQKREGGKIADVLLVRARKGDAVPIPPNYGHITINPGKTPLVMANLVARDFESIYQDYLNMRGGAYYELADGSFRQNPMYGKLPELKVIDAAKRWGRQNILARCLSHPEEFAFLLDPSKYPPMRD